MAGSGSDVEPGSARAGALSGVPGLQRGGLLDFDAGGGGTMFEVPWRPVESVGPGQDPPGAECGGNEVLDILRTVNVVHDRPVVSAGDCREDLAVQRIGHGR